MEGSLTKWGKYRGCQCVIMELPWVLSHQPPENPSMACVRSSWNFQPQEGTWLGKVDQGTIENMWEPQENYNLVFCMSTRESLHMQLKNHKTSFVSSPRHVETQGEAEISDWRTKPSKELGCSVPIDLAWMRFPLVACSRLYCCPLAVGSSGDLQPWKQAALLNDAWCSWSLFIEPSTI